MGSRHRLRLCLALLCANGLALTHPAIADEPVVAQVTAPTGSPAVRGGNEDRSTAGGGLEEVVVTAQKREERLQDVPVPVTAITADALLASGNTRLQDYYSQVPGLSFTSSSTDLTMVAIRGVITGAVETVNNPSVGMVVDDVPYGSSTALGGGSMAPDFDPSALQRIEVLRGPQGTLYGASSLGGLIKYVTVDPSTEGMRTQFTAGTNSVYHGAQPGYNGFASVNVPLADTVAVLASGFTRRDAGYIDNPVLGLRGVNTTFTDGGRISMLWRPSDALTLKLGALYQQVRTGGSNFAEVEPGLGDLQQNDIRNSGTAHRAFQIYTAALTAKLGPATLTSVTGYSVNRLKDNVNYDAGLGFLDALTQQYLGIPDNTTGVLLRENNRTSKITQELRLATPIGSRLDWLIGGFYTHERSPFVQTIAAGDPATGQLVDQWANFDWHVTYTEFAGFTDLTVQVTDRFDVQLGARESHIRETYAEVDTGAFVLPFEGFPSPLVFPEVETNANAFTYLLTPRFKISPDLMVYARMASGYRPGGPNPDAGAFGLPTAYKPDKTSNFELGTKGDTWDHRLSFDASIYYIDWKNIQLSFVDPNNGFGFSANGSRAKSEGVELSSAWKPGAGLTLAGWVAWNEAQLTQPFPPGSSVYGVPGDRLPFSPRWSSSVSVQDEFTLSRDLTGNVGAAVSYVGDRVGNFTAPPPTIPPRQGYSPYAKTDLHAGVQHGRWKINLFIDNIADRRGVVYGGLGTVPNPLAFTYIQPRTVGLSVSSSF